MIQGHLALLFIFWSAYKVLVLIISTSGEGYIHDFTTAGDWDCVEAVNVQEPSHLAYVNIEVEEGSDQAN